MKKNLADKKLVLNPEYILRSDYNRILLTYKNDFSENSYTVFIHPLHAILLSFFDGRNTLSDCLSRIAEIFSISPEIAYEKLSPFIENSKSLNIAYDGERFIFPPKVLIINRTDLYRDDLEEKEKLIIEPPYDFVTKRLNVPRTILFVINTHCITDCIYCYADRTGKYNLLSTDRILTIIEDAKRIGICNFSISGGDIFTHHDWDKILKKIYDTGFETTVSTKYPLTEAMIRKFLETGSTTIQISLDTLSSELATRTLKTRPDYISKIKKAIRILDSKGIEITLKSTVTKETSTIENITEIVKFAKTLRHIKLYTFTPINYSHYKSVEDFNNMKPSVEQVKNVSNYLEGITSSLHFNVKIDDGSVSDGTECRNRKVFNSRALCTGNVDGIVILPDGNVTICEELYWNPNFLIGNITHSSILEVWASEKARSLWKISKKTFPDDSPCKICDTFEECRYGNGVCWKEIIATYGKDNWLYPDRKCPKAPLPFFPVFYDNAFMDNHNNNDENSSVNQSS